MIASIWSYGCYHFMCHYFKLIANVGHIADKLWTLLMPVAVSSFQPRSSFIGGLPEVSHLSNFSNHSHSSKVVHFDQTLYLNIWKFSDSWFTQLLSIKAGAAIISKSPNWRSFLPKKTMAQIIFLRVLILWTCFPSFQRKKVYLTCAQRWNFVGIIFESFGADIFSYASSSTLYPCQ